MSDEKTERERQMMEFEELVNQRLVIPGGWTRRELATIVRDAAERVFARPLPTREEMAKAIAGERLKLNYSKAALEECSSFNDLLEQTWRLYLGDADAVLALLGAPAEEPRAEVANPFKLSCYRCEEPLRELGGLLFSPPEDDDGRVLKRHLCVQCYRALDERPRAEDAQPVGCRPVDVAAIRADARREAFERVWKKTFHMDDCGLSNWLLQEMKMCEPIYQPTPSEPSPPPAKHGTCPGCGVPWDGSGEHYCYVPRAESSPAPGAPVTTKLDAVVGYEPKAIGRMAPYIEGMWCDMEKFRDAALADQRAAVEQATRELREKLGTLSALLDGVYTAVNADPNSSRPVGDIVSEEIGRLQHQISSEGDNFRAVINVLNKSRDELGERAERAEADVARLQAQLDGVLKRLADEVTRMEEEKRHHIEAIERALRDDDGKGGVKAVWKVVEEMKKP